MKQIRKYIEQLEEAGRLLDKGTPTYARLALMLLDNLADVFMFTRIRHEFAFDSRSWRVGPPKYSAEKRKKIMAKFAKKVSFLFAELQVLDFDDGEILKVGHQFRNEAYHRGEVREAIILDVVKSYLGVVGRLIPLLWTGSYAYSGDEVPRFLEKYGLDASHIDEDILGTLCTSILSGRTCTAEELAGTLSQDLLRRVEDFLEGLDILAQDGYIGGPSEEVLKGLQFHQYFLEEYQAPDGNDHDSFVKYHKDRKEWLKAYRPPVTLAVIEHWKRKAERIHKCSRPGASLRDYSNLDRDIHPLEDLVDEAIAYCEMEIDMHR